MTTNEIIIIALIALAAIFNASSDTIDDFYSTSIFRKWNQRFWNPVVSWHNKWKNNGTSKDGEKFPGSSTFLVWTTDAWHLSKMLYLSCIFISIGIATSWLIFGLCVLAWFLFFELFYRLFKREL